MEDPFVSSPAGVPANRETHRYSPFDTQLFSLNASSPSQAKRALEAHLAETERRLRDASQLGTALVEQQRELEEKLKEIESQPDDSELGPELRRKLADLEKEYNDIGRESARTFLPKSRAVSGDESGQGTPGPALSSLSPAVFSSQASSSPSKLTVPSRKQRNQPSSRVHDIEFAAEISTSLLAQVRQLQALLAEREESLKTVNLEKSRLELEAEGYTQRLRALDENEQRYKDENWGLETQIHDLMNAVKEANDRESKLNSNVTALTADKNNVQRELDELRQANSKLVEEHAAAQKAHDSELHSLRRNLTSGDSERVVLQKKVDELTAQNQDLAQAVATRLRYQSPQKAQDSDVDDRREAAEESSPEPSPPPSPNKATPRHGHLETETLRSSLHHAHRMIQNLKSNIHREKTEKIELKRMLQDARDEVEQQRRGDLNGPAAAAKRQKTRVDGFKKPPRPDMLGPARRTRAQIEIDEPDWEDHDGEVSPSRSAIIRRSPPRAAESSDYQTANETEDAFETANEREQTTESEAFQTGAESQADDSTDELTETEDRGRQGTLRGRRKVSAVSLAKSDVQEAYMSTASTSGDEDEEAHLRTPVRAQPPRYRLKINRGGARRSRVSGDMHMAAGSRNSSTQNSPATSFNNDQAPRAISGGQSLFAELEQLNSPGSDGEFGTPKRSDSVSQPSTPVVSQQPFKARHSGVETLPMAPPLMVDSSVMTDPWEPEPVAAAVPVPSQTFEDAGAQTIETEEPVAAVVPVLSQTFEDAGAQTIEMEEPVAAVVPVPSQTFEDAGAQTLEIPEEKRPDFAVGSVQTDLPDVMDSSTQYTPKKGRAANRDSIVDFPTPPKTIWDETQSDEQLRDLAADEKPVDSPRRPSINMGMSHISFEEIQPVAPAPKPEPPTLPELTVSSILTQEVEPLTNPSPPVSPPLIPELSFSSIFTTETVPVKPAMAPAPIVNADEVLSGAGILGAATTDAGTLAHESTTTADRSATDEAVAETAEKAVEPSVTEHSVLESNGVTPNVIKPGVVEPSVVESSVVELSVAKSNGVERNVVDKETQSTMPLGDITGNASTRDRSDSQPDVVLPPVSVDMADMSVQTILSAKQIDEALMNRNASETATPAESKSTRAILDSFPASPSVTPKARPRPASQEKETAQFLHPVPVKRPGSSGSQKAGTPSIPPLPADHKQVIAAASRGMSTEGPHSGSMGPPLAPASAYRTNVQRPRTPNEHALQAPQAPQASSIKNSSVRTTARRSSITSRRSSVSSFASEIDERFNIRPNGLMAPQDLGSNTDPRMIQAITQTMIGEFLWKYTRKAVGGEISNTRHRRYFWVHPYTRTLYWSEQSPQTAGKNEIKAKSVAIEGVRMLPDDNPYPPGLHRKSLEISTPGRKIKVTASTSQRHETWYNALSYLLLRTSSEGAEDGQEHSSAADVDEFNPTMRSASRMTTGRMSLASYNSRTARNTPSHRAGSAMSVRQPVTPGRASPAFSNQGSTLRAEGPGRQSSASRLSAMINTTIRGSFSSQRSRYGQADASVHEGSLAEHDSAEDLRQIIEKQEREADRLENVRACCDGKHDVSSLSRTSRYGSTARRHS